MPMLNASDTIENTLNSIFNDIPSKVVVNIIDNGSTDNSIKIVNQFIKNGARINLKKCEKRGVSHALNSGIHEIDNLWCIRMDCDDIWLKGRYELMERTITKKTAKNKIYGTGADFIDGAKQLIHKTMQRPIRSQKSENIYNSWICNYYSPFIHPTVCFYSEYVKSLGYYPTIFEHCEDYALWARAKMAGAELINLSQATIAYRMEEYGANTRKRNLQLLSHDSVVYRLAKSNNCPLTFNQACLLRSILTSNELVNYIGHTNSDKISIINYINHCLHKVRLKLDGDNDLDTSTYREIEQKSSLFIQNVQNWRSE